MTALPPKADISVPGAAGIILGNKNALPTELSPRIGTFGQTDTLGDLIDRLLPGLLKLFHGLQRDLAVSGELG